MAGTVTILKAEAISLGIQKVFGFTPVIQYAADYATIVLTKQQEETVRQWIYKQMEKKDVAKSDIRFNLSSVLLPVILKKGFPYMAGIFASGMIIGRKTK